MFRRVRRRTVEWRRVAQFEPVRVEGTPVAQEEATDRPIGAVALQPGLRVALARDPENERGTQTVAVESLDEQRLGYLPTEVAAWVAPLLDSGRVTFDGRIYAIEPSSPQSPPAPLSFYLALTQFELRPIEHSSVLLAIRAFLRLPVLGANWCYARAAALYHAFSPTTGPPRDRYATDDRSGS
jgi:hypothetical protein